MAWKIYKIIFTAHSPLHIGFREIGNVVRTRYYIPASTLWGAVTARLTRELFPEGHPQLVARYQDIGDFVKEYLRFGYFFPTEEDISGDYIVYRPELTRDGEMYGYSPFRLSRDQFEKKFVTSITSTALEVSSDENTLVKQTFAAEDGSLHEMEILTAKHHSNGNWTRLLFSGYAYFDEKRSLANLNSIDSAQKKSLEDDDFIFEVITKLFVGGERRYGFGKLVKEKHTLLATVEDPKPYELNETGNNSKLFLASHVPITHQNQAYLKGTIEPYLGRLWGIQGTESLGPGQAYSKAQICWIPGTPVDNQKDKINVGIGGMWELIG